MFWFSLQLLSETFLILKRIKRDTIINVKTSSCKVPFFFSDFIGTLSRQSFEKKLKYQISWKSVHWEPSCAMRQTDRRTATTKLIVAFRTFANASIVYLNTNQQGSVPDNRCRFRWLINTQQKHEPERVQDWLSLCPSSLHTSITVLHLLYTDLMCSLDITVSGWSLQKL